MHSIRNSESRVGVGLFLVRRRKSGSMHPMITTLVLALRGPHPRALSLYAALERIMRFLIKGLESTCSACCLESGLSPPQLIQPSYSLMALWMNLSRCIVGSEFTSRHGSSLSICFASCLLMVRSLEISRLSSEELWSSCCGSGMLPISCLRWLLLRYACRKTCEWLVVFVSGLPSQNCILGKMLPWLLVS